MTPLALDFKHQLAITKKLLAFAQEVCSGTLHAETEFTRKDHICFGSVDKNLAPFMTPYEYQGNRRDSSSR
jgi:hypothetical protein